MVRISWSEFFSLENPSKNSQLAGRCSAFWWGHVAGVYLVTILLLRLEIMCYFVNQASGDTLPGYVVSHENEHSYF